MLEWVDPEDWDLRTVLCSATIREDMQKLAGMTLMRPLMIGIRKLPHWLLLLSPPPAQITSPLQHNYSNQTAGVEVQL